MPICVLPAHRGAVPVRWDLVGHSLHSQGQGCTGYGYQEHPALLRGRPHHLGPRLLPPKLGMGSCFAILMSPWFSRGWTVLELAKSRKVKVTFKGPRGPLLKDLDEQILAKETDSRPHKRASEVIGKLRKRIKTVNNLLTVIGSRSTSWPKDIAIISGLLTGVDVGPQYGERDTWQQVVYKRILRKLQRVSHGHLFHNSATMSQGFSWCPANLLTMPVDSSEATLTVEQDGDLTGTWNLIPVYKVLGSFSLGIIYIPSHDWQFRKHWSLPSNVFSWLNRTSICRKGY